MVMGRLHIKSLISRIRGSKESTNSATSTMTSLKHSLSSTSLDTTKWSQRTVNSRPVSYNWRNPIPDAKVPIKSATELRNYLCRTFTTWNGYPIITFRLDYKRDTVWAHVLIPATGEHKKLFFGYIEDVSWNVQHGFYEKT